MRRRRGGFSFIEESAAGVPCSVPAGGISTLSTRARARARISQYLVLPYRSAVPSRARHFVLAPKERARGSAPGQIKRRTGSAHLAGNVALNRDGNMDL